MPRFYGEVLRPIIAERLSAALSSYTEYDAYNLSEELALARDMAGQVLALYGLAAESNNQELMTSTAVQGISVLQEISKIVESAVKVAHVRDQIRGPIQTALETVIQRMTIVAARVFGDDHRAKELADALREDLQVLPAALGGSGTSILPSGPAVDETVSSMDDTIPEVAQ